MTKIKNILLIGRTGSGKSVIANVLSGSNAFNENVDSTSEPGRVGFVNNFKIKSKQNEQEEIEYRVIDTVGIGVNQLDTREVLYRLGEIVHFIKEGGLNQIFFVTGERFTKEEAEAYNLLGSIIFDQQVFDYTTIIRTKFPEFEDEAACERAREKLLNETQELHEIFSRTKTIFVDNPPLCGRPKTIESNKEVREASRNRLITYLGTIAHKNYKPACLENLNERISGYMNDVERLEKELKAKEEFIKEFSTSLDSLEASIKELKEQKENLKKTISEEIEKHLTSRETTFFESVGANAVA
jgi:GTP-binding protein EngB required for normal cell division